MTVSASYPSGLINFTTKINHIDVYDADHINQLQVETVALQTYIGTNPHGSKVNLTTRLAQMMATNGALAQGAAFPTSPVEGQEFWRTDLQTLYIYGNSAWNSQGQSLSNTLFSFHYTGVLNDTSNGWNSGNSNSAYISCISSKVKKISGVSTVRIYSQVWAQSANGLIVRFSIGSVAGTFFMSSLAPTWVSISLDISGLANGTTYDFVGELFSNNHANGSYMNSIIGFGL